MNKSINREALKRDILVIGASAGGLEALIRLLKHLPHPLSASAGVVIHRHPINNVNLATVIQRATQAPVVEPSTEGSFDPGQIYLAPGDAHLMLTETGFSVRRSAKEHFTRPAVDPLFRSAAAIHKRRVIGVLLSGAGDDGVRGLIDIKAAGGVSLVQDPTEAKVSSMPMNALLYDHVDLVLPLKELSATLLGLMHGQIIQKESSH